MRDKLWFHLQLVLISMFMYASYEVFYGYLLQTDQDKVCLYYNIYLPLQLNLSSAVTKAVNHHHFLTFVLSTTTSIYH